MTGTAQPRARAGTTPAGGATAGPEQVVDHYRVHWRHQQPVAGHYLRSVRGLLYRIRGATLRAHSCPANVQHSVHRLRIERIDPSAMPADAVVLGFVWDPRDPRELAVDCDGPGPCELCT